jgi:sterol desaturase/sphingolipid hydroxylase (fatty acid hydroxylase superfamily)
MMYWLFGPLTRALARLAAVTSLVFLFLLWGQQVTPGVLLGFGPVARQPKGLMVAELFLLSDFVSYWSHRLFHTVPWLWRFHAVHHCATDVKWWSAARLHPINDVLTYLFTVAPFVVFGFPFEGLGPIVPVFAMWGVFLHASTNAALGPLRGIFTSPRHHRWHHTLTHEGGNRNFGGILAIWDRLFGTYYMPDDRMPERFGIDHDDVPADFLGQLTYPWRRVAPPGRD